MLIRLAGSLLGLLGQGQFLDGTETRVFDIGELRLILVERRKLLEFQLDLVEHIFGLHVRIVQSLRLILLLEQCSFGFMPGTLALEAVKGRVHSGPSTRILNHLLGNV